jgi:hypothetical protein
MYCTVIFRYVCDVMDGGQTNTFFPTHAERPPTRFPHSRTFSAVAETCRVCLCVCVCVDNSLQVGPDCGCGREVVVSVSAEDQEPFLARLRLDLVGQDPPKRPARDLVNADAREESERSSPGRRLIFTRAAVHLGPCHHHHHHHHQQIAMPQMGKSFMYVPT